MAADAADYPKRNESPTMQYIIEIESTQQSRVGKKGNE
jgi:hypothetical protein